MSNVTFKTLVEADNYAQLMGGVVLPKGKKFLISLPVVEQAPAEVEAAPVKLTKVQRVIDMLTSGGASVYFIAHALEISKVAAQSLIGDVKRKGYVVQRCAEGENKGMYSIAA